MSDYIKRDDAVAAIKDGAFIFATTPFNLAKSMLIALEKIKNADVRENVRGKWYEQETCDCDIVYECSVCGEQWTLDAGTPMENNMNYCPNCGADMRGETDE